jgi:hypothetical protein
MNKKTKGLLSHVEAGDYFGTVATLLDFIRQGIVKKEDQDRILEDMVEGLVYLQVNFCIKERRQKKSGSF